MFNFFEEIKKSVGKNKDKVLEKFNIVNMAGKLIYVEGHKGLTTISNDIVSFKVDGGRVVIEGEKIEILELTENTLILQGNFKKMEQF